jgi:cytochrome c oxidase cbb3-type subunit 3
MNVEQWFGGSNETINILGGIGFFAVVLITVYVVWVYYKKIKNEKSEGVLAEENWDGIGEYKNDLPTGWTVVTILLIVWAGWYYLIGYPVNSYSQIGEWNQENEEYKAKFQSKWENIEGAKLVAMGESIYLAKCASCHGLTADGLDGRAANLMHRISAESVAHTVKHGSMNTLMEGVMPDRSGIVSMSTGNAISDAEITTVSNYVASGMKGKGAKLFADYCSACHGPDGKGMEFVAPNIAGFNTPELIHVIKAGKKGAIGVMPSFAKEGTLTQVQYDALAAYIKSLSE